MAKKKLSLNRIISGIVTPANLLILNDSSNGAIKMGAIKMAAL